MSDSCNHEMCWIDSVIPSNAKKKNLKMNYLFQKCQILESESNRMVVSIEISDVLKQYLRKIR